MSGYLHSPNLIAHVVLVIMFATLVALYHLWKPADFTLKDLIRSKQKLGEEPGLDMYATRIASDVKRGKDRYN